jgi:ligand-binding SRPBCC domain-containing protein
VDEQIKGPYTKWIHTHKFIPCRNGTLMFDEVIYKVPFGFLGRFFGGWLITRDITKIFNYRKTTITKFF